MHSNYSADSWKCESSHHLLQCHLQLHRNWQFQQRVGYRSHEWFVLLLLKQGQQVSQSHCKANTKHPIAAHEPDAKTNSSRRRRHSSRMRQLDLGKVRSQWKWLSWPWAVLPLPGGVHAWELGQTPGRLNRLGSARIYDLQQRQLRLRISPGIWGDILQNWLGRQWFHR